MSLLTDKQVFNLWHEIVTDAQEDCAIELHPQLKNYLVTLLMRYTNQPELAQHVFATSFLEAYQRQQQQQRILGLQIVGDHCLIFAGLFPHAAHKRHVKLSYFVDLGRSAYSSVSQTANDLYWLLAIQFVMLMDVLQSIRPNNQLLPIEAYEQWRDLESQRALKILQSYTHGIPLKNIKD